MPRRFWQQGYASEAAGAVFDYGVGTLDLSNIVARSFEDNVASVRIIVKLGFILDGRSEINGKTVLRFVQQPA